MTREEVFQAVLSIVMPFARKEDSAIAVTADTHLLDDLMINSERMVDVLLDTEDRFGIRIEDEEASELRTVGEAVDLVMRKLAKTDPVPSAQTV